MKYKKKSIVENIVAVLYRGAQKMYSLFDSEYIWNKVTCSYNSSAVL
jgi:hypothetical protein